MLASMASYLVTWNPLVRPNGLEVFPDDDYRQTMRALAGGIVVRDRWSVSNNWKVIQKGDRVYLLRQRKDRGIVGSALVQGDPFQETHWDGTPGKLTWYVPIEWERLFEIEERILIARLKELDSTQDWEPNGSGISIRNPKRLERLCDERWDHPFVSPEEGGYRRGKEGRRIAVLVSRYERDPRLRTECIAKWGCKCAVCDFEFEECYGAIGQDFIHVHHLVPLGDIGAEHDIDPVSDMRPVCPNCHAMLHRSVDPANVQGLRRSIARRRRRSSTSAH